MTIPLPTVKESVPATAHPYPFQVGLQTQELMHASFFHGMVLDVSAGEYLKQLGGIGKLEATLTQNGLQEHALELGWELLAKYKIIFERAVFQSSLIAMSSHWDWYIRKMVEFVKFVPGHVPGPPLTKKPS